MADTRSLKERRPWGADQLSFSKGVKTATGTKDDFLRDNSALLESFEKESDRGLALVAAVCFEAALERLLLARFYCRTDKRAGLVNPLFDAFGPLSTFSAKIRVAYAIDLLQDWIAGDLDLVRKIRNEFAHNLESTTFHDARIAGMVNQLAGFAKAAEWLKRDSRGRFDIAKIPHDKQSRFKFIWTCARIGALLEAKVITQGSDIPEQAKLKFMLSTRQ